MVFFEVDSRQYIPCAFMKEGSEKKKRKMHSGFNSAPKRLFVFFSFLAFFRIWNPFEKYLCALSKY